MAWCGELTRPGYDFGLNFVFSKWLVFHNVFWSFPPWQIHQEWSWHQSQCSTQPFLLLPIGFPLWTYYWCRNSCSRTSSVQTPPHTVILKYLSGPMSLQKSFTCSWEKTGGCRPVAFSFWILLEIYGIRNISIVHYFRQIRFKEKNTQEDCQYSGSKTRSPN